MPIYFSFSNQSKIPASQLCGPSDQGAYKVTDSARGSSIITELEVDILWMTRRAQMLQVKIKQFVSFHPTISSTKIIQLKEAKVKIERKTVERKLPMDFYIQREFISTPRCNSQVTNSGEDYETYLTFQSENSRIRIHKSRIRSYRPPQRLIWHVHINDNHAILWSGFSNTYILIRFHRHVRERDELRIDANARQLQSQVRSHKPHHSNHYLAKEYISNNEQLCFSLSSSESERKKNQICAYFTVSKLVK